MSICNSMEREQTIILFCMLYLFFKLLNATMKYLWLDERNENLRNQLSQEFKDQLLVNYIISNPSIIKLKNYDIKTKQSKLLIII